MLLHIPANLFMPSDTFRPRSPLLPWDYPSG